MPAARARASRGGPWPVLIALTSMPVSPSDFLLALTIGAEVFAIAALWPLSEWAVAAPRHWGLAGALSMIAAFIALHLHGLAFAASPIFAWRELVGTPLGWALLPLSIVFPDAVCVASAQSLARAGVPARPARATALFAAALAVTVTPFATLVAGCGLAGACL